MAIITLYYKYAKEYEEQGIVKIIKPHNAIKDDDIVKVITIERIGGRRSGKTAKLKELINKSLDKPNKILYNSNIKQNRGELR